jgi:hypothetical protein
MAISHNLLPAAGTMAGPTQAVARTATLRRTIITVPARLAQPQRRPVLHLPAHWPWVQAWLTLWGPRPRSRAPTTRASLNQPTRPPRARTPGTLTVKSWADQQPPPAHHPKPGATSLGHILHPANPRIEAKSWPRPR